MSEKEVSEEPTVEAVTADTCGLIMPISATAAHDKGHWDDMLKLLTRAIESAGCVARPVWINSSADRVSERIVGNIFSHPVVIADITDLNPNVMFELGLRLASKKPTLAIMEEGGSIPFDIRDFHIHLYPRNLSIIGMEKFLGKLAKDVKAKKDAFERNEYTPFLSTVVVDVVSPDQREVGINTFMLGQLEDINRRLSKLDRPLAGARVDDPYDSYTPISKSESKSRTVWFATIPQSSAIDFVGNVSKLVDEVVEIDRDGDNIYYAMLKRGPVADHSSKIIGAEIRSLISRSDGVNRVPRFVCDVLDEKLIALTA